MDTQLLRNTLKRLKRKFGSFAAAGRDLEISQAHIYNFMSGKRQPSPVLIKALQDKRYLEAPKKRIRSQITWKSEEQKLVFLKYIKKQGFHNITEYCRDQANAVRDGALVGGFIPYLTVDHIGESLGRYPIDTGEDL